MGSANERTVAKISSLRFGVQLMRVTPRVMAARITSISKAAARPMTRRMSPMAVENSFSGEVIQWDMERRIMPAIKPRRTAPPSSMAVWSSSVL